MKAYTDASVIEGGSIHSYVIYDKDDNILLMDRARAEINDSMAAEMVSVISLLMKCRELLLKNVTVHTDNKPIISFMKKHYLINQEPSKGYKKYEILINAMRNLLRMVGGSIKWISRKQNKVADGLCREMKDGILFLKQIKVVKEPFASESNKISILEERVLSSHLALGGISIDTTSVEDSEHIWQYYCSLVIKNKRNEIGEILNWGATKKHRNSKKGRRYFVERYIEESHSFGDLNAEKIHHAFEIK